MQPHQAECLPYELSRRRAHDCRRCAIALVVEQIAERHPIRLEQLIFAHPLVVVQLREIALAGVAEEGHDERIGIIDLARDLKRNVCDQPRRSADEQALLRA